MDSLFSHCYSLFTFPNIFKWNCTKVEFMRFMFFNCYSLPIMPDVSSIKTKKKSAKNFMFNECINANPIKSYEF